MARGWWRKLVSPSRRQSSPEIFTEDLLDETSFSESRSRTSTPNLVDDTVFTDSIKGPIVQSSADRLRAYSTPIPICSSTSHGSSSSLSYNDLDSSLTSCIGGMMFAPPTYRDAASVTDLTRGHLSEWEKEIRELQLKLDRARDEMKCIICLQNRRAVMFSPCHHVVACLTCADKLPGGSSMAGGFKNCPICRRCIEKRTKIFLG